MSIIIQNYDDFSNFASLVPFTNLPLNYNPLNYGYYVNTQDVNQDLNLQKKVIKYIWNKLSSKWILNYIKVFKFIKGSKGSFKFVDSIDEAENNKLNNADLEEKAIWLFDTFYKRSNLASTIEKFRNRMEINWWDIEDYKEELNAFIYHQMRRMILHKYLMKQ